MELGGFQGRGKTSQTGIEIGTTSIAPTRTCFILDSRSSSEASLATLQPRGPGAHAALGMLRHAKTQDHKPPPREGYLALRTVK